MPGRPRFGRERNVAQTHAADRHLGVAGTRDVVDLSELLTQVARGDESAFAALYDHLGSSVYGLARRVIRDPARAEEVAQEVFLQVWQTAARFDPERGRAKSWVMTLAHRRAVDAVRHDQAATNRDKAYDWSAGPDFDVVNETVTVRLEHEQVRKCMEGLTDLQREAIDLAYYKGYTYAECATVLEANPATVKTRMRDGLVRLRDCLGVASMTVDLHSLIAPYALDALEADDRSRFEAHLALCEECREELVGFVATAARLGEAQAATPPAELRERLATMAASTSQEHPVVTALSQRSRVRRVAPRIILAAAVAAAVLGIGGFVAEKDRADDLSAERARMVAVLTAEDGAMTVDDASGGGNVRVVASKSQDAAVVLGESLPALDDDQIYQVWHMEDGKPTSVGLLGHGPDMLYVPSIKGAEAYAVSVEPSGGSPQPTTEPIAAAPV